MALSDDTLEDWLDLNNLPTDGSVNDRDLYGKRMTLAQEFIADTDPNNPNDLFQCRDFDLGAEPEDGLVFHFHSSARRLYTLQATTDLVNGPWEPVPGAGPRLGVGGPDSLTDENTPPIGTTYRLTVELPEL